MQTGMLERRGRKQGNFRHKRTSSKALQSQLAAPSSKRLSESRDLFESEPSIQTDVNFEKGQVQIVSSWAPSPDKRVPPWGSRAAESSGSPWTDLSLPGSPGFFIQLLGHDQPTLGLFVSLSRDFFLSSGSSAKQFFGRGGDSAWLNGVWETGETNEEILEVLPF